MRGLGDGALSVKFACQSVWKVFGDGAIIQIGTPEELVIQPADDYVAEFTREVSRARVLSVRSVIWPATGGRLIGELERDDPIAVLIGRDRRH